MTHFIPADNEPRPAPSQQISVEPSRSAPAPSVPVPEAFRHRWGRTALREAVLFLLVAGVVLVVCGLFLPIAWNDYRLLVMIVGGIGVGVGTTVYLINVLPRLVIGLIVRRYGDMPESTRVHWEKNAFGRGFNNICFAYLLFAIIYVLTSGAKFVEIFAVCGATIFVGVAGGIVFSVTTHVWNQIIRFTLKRFTLPGLRAAPPDMDTVRLEAPSEAFCEIEPQCALASFSAAEKMPPLAVEEPETQPPNPQRWYLRACVAVVSACVAVVSSGWHLRACMAVLAGGGAWLLAGSWFWYMLSIFGVLGLAVYLAAFGRLLIRREKIDRDKIHTFVYRMFVLSAWFGIGLWFQNATIIVDNANSMPLRVLVDGAEWITISPRSSRVETLRHGIHRFTVLNTKGQQLDELVDMRAEGDGVYILNLLKAQTYLRGYARYGLRERLDSSEPEEIDDVWIEAKVDYLFEDPPLLVTFIRNRNDSSKLVGISRSYLKRGTGLPNRQRDNLLP